MSWKVREVAKRYPWQATGGVTAKTLRWVAYGLADAAGHDGRNAHPGLRRLAAETGMHTETVQRALVVLESLGVVVLVRAGTRTRAAVYDLDLVALSTSARKTAHPAPPVSAHLCADQSAHSRADQSAHNGPTVHTVQEADDRGYAAAGLAGIAAARAAMGARQDPARTLEAHDLTRQRAARRFARYQGAEAPAIVDPGATERAAG